MRVDETSITGDLYQYENSSNTVLKSEYGVFIFTREGDLEGFEGRIPPYMVDFLTGESVLEKNVEIAAYSTEDHLLFPLYETDGMEPGRCFVVDGETCVQFGRIEETSPRMVGSDAQSGRIVEVHSTPLRRGESRPVRDYVERDVVREVFENNPVERVFVT